MAVPTTTRTSSFSWTKALAVMSFLGAAWAAIQVGFLAWALNQGPPSPDSRLVFEHHNEAYLYSLIFHALVLVAFGALGLLAGEASRQVNRMRVGARRTSMQVVYATVFLLPALALYMVFRFSTGSPTYQIYVEDSSQEIVRLETHLVPPGSSKRVIAYRDIRVISGKMDYSSWWGDRYFLSVITMDWKTMDIAQGSRYEDPELLFPLARDVASNAGVEVDLGSKLPQFR